MFLKYLVLWSVNILWNVLVAHCSLSESPDLVLFNACRSLQWVHASHWVKLCVSELGNKLWHQVHCFHLTEGSSASPVQPLEVLMMFGVVLPYLLQVAEACLLYLHENDIILVLQECIIISLFICGGPAWFLPMCCLSMLCQLWVPSMGRGLSHLSSQII